MWHRLSSLWVGRLTVCRFDKLPCDFAQGLSLSNGKALSLPMGRACGTLFTLLLLAVGARGQVLERLVSLQDAAAGSFPSGKLIPASDGNFYGSTEVGGSGGATANALFPPTPAYPTLPP